MSPHTDEQNRYEEHQENTRLRNFKIKEILFLTFLCIIVTTIVLAIVLLAYRL